MLPTSPAAERNKGPLLEVLESTLGSRCLQVLEIGSGTGQHAVHFANSLPNLTWQTSDLVENHSAVSAWLAARGSDNLRAPLALDVDSCQRLPDADVIFTANTLHIMSWDSARRLIDLVGASLAATGRFIVYGPFNVGGLFTSDSNRRFDESLRLANPAQGLRHREEVCWRADGVGLSLTQQLDMPANNQVLVFERRSGEF